MPRGRYPVAGFGVDRRYRVDVWRVATVSMCGDWQHPPPIVERQRQQGGQERHSVAGSVPRLALVGVCGGAVLGACFLVCVGASFLVSACQWWRA